MVTNEDYEDLDFLQEEEDLLEYDNSDKEPIAHRQVFVGTN
jgi:hypothetical protein